MKQAGNVYNCDLLSIIFKVYVTYFLLQTFQQQYMKIKLFVYHKLEEDILKAIERIIFHQSSSILMNFNRATKLM